MRVGTPDLLDSRAGHEAVGDVLRDLPGDAAGGRRAWALGRHDPTAPKSSAVATIGVASTSSRKRC
jgi:hypothetical protein